MQPSKANIDGVSRNPMPLSPAVERRPEETVATTPAKKAVAKPTNVKTSTMQTGPIVVIVLTVVIMVFLIALTYLAYTKSK